MIQKKYLFFPSVNKQAVLRKNKVPEHSLKLERWQSLPHVNKVKQYEIVLSFKVSLFISVFSVMTTKRVCFFHLFRH